VGVHTGSHIYPPIAHPESSWTLKACEKTYRAMEKSRHSSSCPAYRLKNTRKTPPSRSWGSTQTSPRQDLSTPPRHLLLVPSNGCSDATLEVDLDNVQGGCVATHQSLLQNLWTLIVGTRKNACCVIPASAILDTLSLVVLLNRTRCSASTCGELRLCCGAPISLSLT